MLAWTPEGKRLLRAAGARCPGRDDGGT